MSDRKPETVPVSSLAAGAVQAVEGPEDSVELVGRNPGSAVAYFDGDFSFIAIQIDVYRAVTTILHGVLEQIGQHSFKSDRITKINTRRVSVCKPKFLPAAHCVRGDCLDNMP